MFESVEKEVVFLKRVSIGEIRLGCVPRGTVRELRPDETEYLSLI